MSRKHVLIFILIVHSVLSKDCVRYYFEDYDDSFTTDNSVTACDGQALWKRGIYDNELSITAPHEDSRFFISPSNATSCTGSFTFTMMPGAVIEFKIYVVRGTDLSFIIRLRINTGANYHNVTRFTLPNDVKDGWNVIYVRNTVLGNNPFQGNIVFEGFASEDSVLIVDSFRYIPLTMDPEEECILYDDIETPTTAPVPIDPTTTMPTPTTSPTTPATSTPTITPTTDPAPITPVIISPNNVTIIKEIVDIRKYFRKTKKRITKVINFAQ